MINSGALEASLELLDDATKQSTIEQLKLLWETPSWQFYVAGAERFIAIILQIALSVLVYKAVSSKSRKYWFLAFGIHFAVDFVTVVITGLGTPVWVAEIVLLIAVVLIAHYTYTLYKEETV